MKLFDKYMLIKNSNLQNFNFDITDHLQHGWRLHGQLKIVLSRGDGTVMYFREMVKEVHSGEALEETSGERLFEHFNE